MEDYFTALSEAEHAITIANVDFVKLCSRRNISNFPANQRIATDYLMAFLQEMLCEVTAQKPSDTGDEYFHCYKKLLLAKDRLVA